MVAEMVKAEMSSKIRKNGMFMKHIVCHWRFEMLGPELSSKGGGGREGKGGGEDLPGTATAAAPAEAARVGASRVGLLARLALLGRCSPPRR